MTPIEPLAFGITALTFAVAVGITYGMAWWLLVRRNAGVWRLPLAYLSLMLVTWVALPFGLLYEAVVADARSDKALLVLLVATFNVANVLVLVQPVRVWLRQRSVERVSEPYTWWAYFQVAGAIVFLHFALIRLYDSMVDTGIRHDSGTPEWLMERFSVSILLFCFGQLTTSWAVRSLARSLRSDWSTADGQPLGRDRQYALVALALLPCAIVSISLGPLLAGVLWRLAMLFRAWKHTSEPPAAGQVFFRRAASTLSGRWRALLLERAGHLGGLVWERLKHRPAASTRSRQIPQPASRP